MEILVIGNGGREHALIWKLKQSTKVKNIYCAAGNAGTNEIAHNIDLKNSREIISWLKNNRLDLVVVGPDNYLAEGIVDKIQKLNIPVFGPSKAASKIEWSKSFAKKFMLQEKIPTARYKAFTKLDKAQQYIRKEKFPLVIKASGLALGKGVIIAANLEEAEKTLIDILRSRIFGEAGREIIIEEYLEGREISIHAWCDGKTAKLFPASADHKRIFDNDKGPNTGGMGTIAPVTWVTEQLLETIQKTIVLPTLRGLKRQGREFKGVLFPGIIVTEDGPKVIEFNARFGDPETQSYMRILESDLVDILFACINGKLSDVEIKWSNKSACCIILASKGYPGNYKINEKIAGINNSEREKGVVVFHSGTKDNNRSIVTNGGRVLGVTATGKNLRESLTKSYKSVSVIKFRGKNFRKDIGKKSLI